MKGQIADSDYSGRMEKKIKDLTKRVAELKKDKVKQSNSIAMFKDHVYTLEKRIQ